VDVAKFKIATQMKLFDKIEAIISTLNVETIAKERKEVLQPLVDFLNDKTKN